MTNFKKIQKSHGKIYKERAQPEHREHLGVLTKKRDFKQVSKLRHKIKAKTIEKEKLIQERNPDEFYYRMLRKNKLPEDAYTEGQVKEFMSKDVKYLEYKLGQEDKQINKLRSKLTMPSKPACLTIFVDDKTIDVAAMSKKVTADDLPAGQGQMQRHSQEQLAFLTELHERLERAKALKVELGTLQCKLNILSHKDRRYKVIREGSKTQAPIVRYR